MGRWGRCDYRELKKLDERLQQLSEVDMDRLCRDAAKKIAQILLNKVKKRTPVGVVPPYATDEAKEEYWPGYRGGSLRDAWTILPIEKGPEGKLGEGAVHADDFRTGSENLGPVHSE